MGKITVDFKNSSIIVCDRGTNGTMFYDKPIEDFSGLIPKPYYEKRTCFTWDFDNNSFFVNETNELPEGAILLGESIKPILKLPLEIDYDSFIKHAELEEVQITEEEINAIINEAVAACSEED